MVPFPVALQGSKTYCIPITLQIMKKYHRVLILTLLLLPQMLLFQQRVQAQSPVFVGHRGASYLAPENTLASFALAWELGAAAAECDVMLTSDNQVIVFHDNKGKRLTGTDFVVKETRFDEIKDLPILLKNSNLEKFAGQTIPLLSEVLATVPRDRTLVIEIKTGPEIMPYLEEVIDAHWKSGNIAFISFDFDAILLAKATFPGMPCYYLSVFKREVRSKMKEIIAGGLDGVNLRYRIIDKNLVEKYNKAGLDVWCWTVNDPAEARKLVEAGVSAITTDRPAWLKEQVF